MTHLPIPIDGSNNGWQHLGSISKDVQTGDLVRLIPIEIPIARKVISFIHPTLGTIPKVCDSATNAVQKRSPHLSPHAWPNIPSAGFKFQA